MVKALLKSSSSEINNINDSGETPLILAVKNENQYIAELLIENKADVNLAANNGESPLHFSAKKIIKISVKFYWKMVEIQIPEIKMEKLLL